MFLSPEVSKVGVGIARHWNPAQKPSSKSMITRPFVLKSTAGGFVS